MRGLLKYIVFFNNTNGGMESKDSGGLLKQEPEEEEHDVIPSDFGVGENDEGVPIKIENSDSDDHEGDNFSPSWNSSSEEGEEVENAGTKRKMPFSLKKPRGRPKQPRRINMTEGTSSENEDSEKECKPIPGLGYPVEFKMKVLKYAENHSNSATAEKFGLQPKRVRDWKEQRDKIEERISSGCYNKRRPRSDGFTIEEKLKAVALAEEHSIDAARSFYGVDRDTIGKWKANKKEMEASVLKGEGNRKTLPGAGMKPKYTKIEKSLREWVVALREKNVDVTSKMILSKANSLIKEDPSMQGVSGPKTWNWVNGFLKRQKLQQVLGSSNRKDTAELPKEAEERIVEEMENNSGLVTTTSRHSNSLKQKHEAIEFEETSSNDAKQVRKWRKQTDNLIGEVDNQPSSPIHIKNDDDNTESLSSCRSNENSMSSSDDEIEEKKIVTTAKNKGTKKKVGVGREKSVQPKRSRGRPKQPRRLNVSSDYTSEEEEEKNEGDIKSELQPGCGYPVEFKLKVLKYAETHSSSATADKFGLRPSRIRIWKKYKSQIEEKSKASLKRPKRSFTVEEKLQTIAFASERSMNEAELLYNVDRNAIRKWIKQKDELEAMILQGKGDSLKQKGCGSKLKYAGIEQDLRDWIVALRLKNVTLNHKMILNKAKSLIDENPSMQGLSAPRSAEWVVKFLKRHSLHGLLGNTFGREDPREILEVEFKNSENVGKNFDNFVEIPENPNKRNRKTISLEDRVNIIRRIEQGETQGNVAKSLKTATSTIQTIWSSRNEILHKYANPKSKTKSDAILWKTYNVIGAALLDWVEQNSSKSLNVNSSNLMEKAIQLSETYRLSQFPSEAKQWLRIFCKRHNLFDILTELKSSTTVCSGGNATSSSASLFKTCPENAYSNSLDSDDNHDNNDNVHSDSIYNDFPSINHSGPHQSFSLPTHSSLYYNQTENNKRFSTLCSNADKNPVISNTEAVKCYSLLRNWINANYGHHEDILSNQLSMVENSILKRNQ